MRFIAHEDFGLDLSEEETTSKLAARLPQAVDGPMEIDLSQCLIDYKATSVLMDAALDRLANSSEPRHLVIIFNVKFQERLFLKWLFFGSVRLKLDVGTFSDEEIRHRIIEGLCDLHVKLTVTIAEDEIMIATYSLGYDG